MSRACWVIAGVLASTTGCPATPGEEDDGVSEGSSTDDETSSTAASDDTGGTGPSGPCPLEGMFVDCDASGAEGVAYCDEIDGELQWGPCLAGVDCELGESLVGCQSCTLEEGVPTVTGSPTCECEGPAGVPVCQQTECLQRWSYDCGLCESFISGDCFSYDLGCANPWLGCGTGRPSPCGRVWVQEGQTGLDAIEDEPAAVCMLESLRDGVSGTYRLEWGFMDDSGWVVEQIHAHGDGTAVVEWQFDCPGCFNSGDLGRSGTLSLQPAGWFDDCLADPTVERLIECLVGIPDEEYQSSRPPPEGYVPPFVTGECVSLDTACP